MRLPDWRFGLPIGLLAVLISASGHSADDNGLDLSGALVPKYE
jgi:hypothetical protein